MKNLHSITGRQTTDPAEIQHLMPPFLDSRPLYAPRSKPHLTRTRSCFFLAMHDYGCF